jgi:murein DD-endopeptidase MepM/ murein hydrolase activator NlpD
MRGWKQTVPVVLILLSLSHCSTCNNVPLNSAAGIGWRGYVDTDLSLAGLGEEYTIAFRFLLQYPNAYAAPIISDSASGNFYVAKDYFNDSLIVNFNGTTRSFSASKLAGSVWHHVTVRRNSTGVTVFLNGSAICPDTGSCTIPPGGSTVSGVLRLGRSASAITFSNRDGQFYGFIDDVAVFKKALDTTEIAALAAQTRLTGTESDLFAGYSFDTLTPSGGALPASMKGPVTFETHTPGAVIPGKSAYRALVSQARDSAFDAKLLPIAFQQKALKLPFPAGEAWEVIQGWDSPASTDSHNGAASFCWDFKLAGKDASETKGKPIFAAAGGKVVETRNDRDSCVGAPSSYVMIEQAPLEIGAYLHFVMGSVEVSDGTTVSTGTKLAQAGDTGNSGCGGFHLHFSLHTAPESQPGTLVTFPGAFSDYEVSTDSGVSWSHIDRGVPKLGEWVRNP